MKIITLVLAALVTSCAHTTLYRDGKPVARFEGDMTNMQFRSHPDGTIEWSCNVSHSAATLAQGKAASDKISAVGGAAAAAGIVTLVK